MMNNLADIMNVHIDRLKDMSNEELMSMSTSEMLNFLGDWIADTLTYDPEGNWRDEFKDTFNKRIQALPLHDQDGVLNKLIYCLGVIAKVPPWDGRGNREEFKAELRKTQGQSWH